MMATLGKRFVILGMTALISVLPAALHAETAAPLLGPESKLFKGRSVSSGGKSVATYDNSFYVAVREDADNGEGNLIRVARIPMSGSAADVTRIAVSNPSGALTGALSMAVSENPASAGQKIVHLIWSQGGDEERALFYSKANADKLDNWSVPVRIDGNNAKLRAASLVASRKGDLHVVFIGDGPKLYYTKAPAGTSKFTKPSEVPGIPNFAEREVDTALDIEGNLHVAFVAAESPSYEIGNRLGLQYVSLKAGAKKWSAPKAIIPFTTLNENGAVSIAASDAKNIFIASGLDRKSLDVFRSNDSGATWSKSVVATSNISTSPTIAVAPDKSVIVGAVFDLPDKGIQEARIFRSADGTAWSPAAAVSGLFEVIVAADAKGKTAVFANKSDDAGVVNYLLREK